MSASCFESKVNVATYFSQSPLVLLVFLKEYMQSSEVKKESNEWLHDQKH